MLTAQEAHKKSVDKKFSLEKTYKSNVEVLIEKAIDEGEFSILYEGMMYASLQKELETKGYKIGKVHRFSNSGERICWEISWECVNNNEN